VIHVEFLEPTFVCELEDLNGRVLEELHHAESKESLEADLQKRIQEGLFRRVVSLKPYDFQKWKTKASGETEKAIAEYKAGKGDDYKFKDDVWGALKEVLIDVFHGKCAYCDARFGHVAWGDVEHYRPKKKVTDSSNAAITIENGQPHPGYYWLAYDPSNLLPSCQVCNQAKGKMNQFPIAGKRASRPEDDLQTESPLLLHPYRDKPRDHLNFIPSLDDKAFGTVASATDSGKASIEVYRLNREALIDERRSEQNAARREVKDAFLREDVKALVKVWKDYEMGLRQFSSAALAEVNSFFSKMGMKRLTR